MQACRAIGEEAEFGQEREARRPADPHRRSVTDAGRRSARRDPPPPRRQARKQQTGASLQPRLQRGGRADVAKGSCPGGEQVSGAGCAFGKALARLLRLSDQPATPAADSQAGVALDNPSHITGGSAPPKAASSTPCRRAADRIRRARKHCAPITRCARYGL